MKFYRCDLCGNLVEMINESGVSMVCCSQDMTELIPGTTDGATEKHVPVVKINGHEVTVTVGTEIHPMLEDHYIEWIILETNTGVHRINLTPGSEPKATFTLAKGETVVNVYSYCNLHGLWLSEKKIGTN